jgi:uncharacterized protein involved in outer membrane biogenesis
MNKVKKLLLFIVSALLIVVILVILFVSPITKYLVEKYDEKYTGRQIKMDWAYVNPFTGYVHLHNLKINEFKSDSVFFSVVGLSADLAIYKLLNKTYQIEDITLNHPKGTFIQQKKELNIDDLINKFSSSKDDDMVSTKPSVHFNIVNVKIIGGEFHYREKQIHINYFIKNVNIESSGKVWDSDTVGAKFSFVSGIGKGDAKGTFSINLQTLEYNISTLVQHYDLNLIEQYIKDMSNYGSLNPVLMLTLKHRATSTTKKTSMLRGNWW